MRRGASPHPFRLARAARADVASVEDSIVSAEADLIAATARKGRGLKDRAKGAHLDDIAAGVLLDRYFAGTHGEAEEIPPM